MLSKHLAFTVFIAPVILSCRTTAAAAPATAAISPMQRESEGESFADEGKYKEALDDYRWCFDHGLEADHDYRGVRLSFLLGKIVELGKKYPPASQALQAWLKDDQDAILAGTATAQQEIDFSALCRELEDLKRVIAVVTKLNATRPHSTKTCRRIVDDVVSELASQRQYEVIATVLGDDQDAWLNQKMDFARELIDYQTNQSPMRNVLTLARIEFPLDQLTDYYEAFVATGHVEFAKKVGDEILSLSKLPNRAALLADAAQRALAKPATSRAMPKSHS